MPRYAAFLRGVTPMNAAMPELKRAFEDAGFTDVVTVLSSGTVVFTAVLLSYRWLPVQMAHHAWLAGPLLLLATASVVVGYARTTGQWSRTAAPQPRPEPQPEPI